MANNKAAVKKETVDLVADRVRQLQNYGELHLPPNYSAENALKSAWLLILETKNKNDKPALECCTRESVYNALLDMVIQGLNPVKKQGYFMVYGNKLVFQRSYFGTMSVTKQVASNIKEIISEVVYEGDVFKYRINRGKKEIVEHEQSIENVNAKKIMAAYCMVIDSDEQITRTEVMTFDEIKQSWKQSLNKPFDDKGNIRPGTTHDKFPGEMCKRTVINRACKPIINSSNDSNLFRQSVNRSSEIMEEEKISEEIAENANGQIIDVEAEVIDEPETGDGQQTKMIVSDQPPKQSEEKKETKQMSLDDSAPDGPGF